MQVVMNKCFLLNPERKRKKKKQQQQQQIGADPTCRFREKTHL